MKDYRVAMLLSLVAVAWADEQLHARELEVIEALVSAFGLADDEAAQVREYAKTPRSLDDLPLSEASTRMTRASFARARLSARSSSARLSMPGMSRLSAGTT